MINCKNCNTCSNEENKKLLSELKPGESAYIISLAHENFSFKRRLLDMGFTPGTMVFVKKTAPFGDPTELRIRGYEISLRKEYLSKIYVGKFSMCCHAFINRKSAGFHRHIFKNNHRHHDHLTWHRFLRENKFRHFENKSINKKESAAKQKKRLKIALTGNPNSGKTTVFNKLTGSNQYVGNWPGVTVEKKEGFSEKFKEIKIVDLPGVYSLSPYSIEEIVTRNYIIGVDEAAADVIINIVDATNLERNLYLTVQLIELERPMVIALNFMDEAKEKGIEIDVQKLSGKIGFPIVPVVGKTGENLENLLQIAKAQVLSKYIIEPDNLYDDLIQKLHDHIGEVIYEKAKNSGFPVHWSAIKLIEKDKVAEDLLGLDENEKKTVAKIMSEFNLKYESVRDHEILISDSRYFYIEKIIKESGAIKKAQEFNSQSLSDSIDKILTHKIFAIPVFIFAMLVMFTASFGPIGNFFSQILGRVAQFLTISTETFLKQHSTPSWITGIITDGAIKGVGSVLTFIPQISLLFLFLSIMEDSGYMSRVAFIMDKLFRSFGLSGKSFIPMIMGFGCSVPAVMGARIMENEKDRRMTIFLIPFMSCSAKLPVYGLIASAFFGKMAGLVIFVLYIFGISMAIITGLIFKKKSDETSSFIMELPPYRMPSIRNISRNVWSRLKDFLLNAGTLIFSTSIILWFLQNFDITLGTTDDISKSILAFLGGIIAPIFRPLGFGSWQTSVALLTGIIAKETIVVSLSMFYGFSLTENSRSIASSMSTLTPLCAFSLLAFISLYVPCIAAVSAIYLEMKSLKWTLKSVFWQLGIAYITSFIIYQTGKVLGF